MTGIGENTLAQPVKPPLRERCACLAKLVKNRLTLTNKHLRKTLVEAAWHYLTCSGRPKDLAKGQAPDRGARRHAAKGVRRLVERREALLARGVHGNKANVATARELACWVWAVGLMAEEA